MKFEEGLLLTKLTSNSIACLINDSLLRILNAKIHYVVDTYDIIEYCYPYFQRQDSPKINTSIFEEFSFKYLAYQYLFEDYQNKPIVPNEYLRELTSFKYHLNFEIKKGVEVYEKIKPFLDDNLEKVSKKDFDSFKSRINTILALTMGMLTSDDIDKYNHIIKERLDIFSFSNKNSKDREIISNLFASTKSSNLTKKIFEEFYEKIKNDLIRNNPTPTQSYRYLENAYRDITVIDRCLQINNKTNDLFLKGEISKRYIFHYLSSAPRKTDILFNLPSIKANLPTIELKQEELTKLNGLEKDPLFNKQINILRNVYQLFLLSSIITDQTNSNVNLYQTLKKWYACSTEQENLKNIEKAHEEKEHSLKLRKELPSLIRKELYQTTLLRKFFYHKEKIEDALTNSNISKNNGAKSLKELLKQVINSEELLENANSCSQKLTLHTLNFSVRNQLYQLSIKSSDDRSILTIAQGKDIVRSYFQQLPILLFCNSINNIQTFKVYQEALEKISRYLSDPVINNPEEKKIFVEAYRFISRNLVSEIKSHGTIIGDSILLCFLSLILPKENENNISDLKSEVYIIDQLEEIKNIAGFAHHKAIVDQANNKLKVTKYDNPYEIEIDYLLVWLYRRQLNFKMAIETADNSLNKCRDPRILQGKALALIAELDATSKGKNHSKEVDKLKEAILLLEESHKRYINGYFSDDPLILRTIIAINNSIAFAYNRIYDLTSDDEYLDKAFYFLELMESGLAEIDLDLRKLPSFCHTALRIYVNTSFRYKEEDQDKSNYLFSLAIQYEVVLEEDDYFSSNEERYKPLLQKLKKLKSYYLKQYKISANK